MGTLHQKVRAAELLMRAKAWPACQPEASPGRVPTEVACASVGHATGMA